MLWEIWEILEEVSVLRSQWKSEQGVREGLANWSHMPCFPSISDSGLAPEPRYFSAHPWKG